MDKLVNNDFSWHADQPDVPQKTAAEMKEFFDAPTHTLMDKVNEIIDGKQDTLIFDDEPTAGSDKPVKSKGVLAAIAGLWTTVQTALAGKQDTLDYDQTPTENSTKMVKSGGIYTAIAALQAEIDDIGIKEITSAAQLAAAENGVYYHRADASHPIVIDTVSITGEAFLIVYNQGTSSDDGDRRILIITKSTVYHAVMMEDSGGLQDWSISEGLTGKQNTLTAGDNISIVGNVISAAASGGGMTEIEDQDDLIAGDSGLYCFPGSMGNEFVIGDPNEPEMATTEPLAFIKNKDSFDHCNIWIFDHTNIYFATEDANRQFLTISNTVPQVDQTYMPGSERAQSGRAVAAAISGKQDRISAGPGIGIDHNQISAQFTYDNSGDLDELSEGLYRLDNPAEFTGPSVLLTGAAGATTYSYTFPVDADNTIITVGMKCGQAQVISFTDDEITFDVTLNDLEALSDHSVRLKTVISQGDRDGDILFFVSYGDESYTGFVVSAGDLFYGYRPYNYDTGNYNNWAFRSIVSAPDVTMTYKSYDGSATLYRQVLINGDDGQYTGVTPARASTAQYNYTFSGWSTTPGGSADPDALKNVTENRTVYAAFTATVRTYTVTFMNGETTLQTVQDVPYGGTASYTGVTPVKQGVQDPESYEFVGWNPSPEGITGDTICNARFVYADTITDSWSEISAHSLAGDAENYYAIGDCKDVDLSGTVGTSSLNVTLLLYIIGFNHNSTYEGTGITFAGFKTGAVSSATSVCIVDTNYGSGSTDGSKRFNVNHWGNANYGGWAGCDMRYDILGSTDVAPSGYGSATTAGRVGYDATSTCATSPVANTLMSCLPSDLRAVMKPITKYTNNAGGSSNIEANVTASVDYLPLLAEYEIYGVRTYANEYEQTKQAQYAYYIDGNSKVKYQNINTSSAASWWERSPYISGSISFCNVTGNGSDDYNHSDRSYGITPVLLV